MQRPFSPVTFLGDVLSVYATLLKILIPAILLVKILEMTGAIEGLSHVLAPLMQLVGLPPEFGVVWAATLLTNIFTGLVVLFEVLSNDTVSVAEMTVLGSLLLIGHSLPVEGSVAKRAGVPWWVTLLLRVGGALFFAAIIHQLQDTFGWGQEMANLRWQPEPSSGRWQDWLLAQGQTLLLIFGVIATLMLLLEMIKRLGLESVMNWLLSPLLATLGIGRAATNVTVIGTTLGLSYGAGLLIRDLDRGVMSPRDSFLVLCFLGLCHSIIEDTLLILLIDADLWAILGARLAFAVMVVALMARSPWLRHLTPARSD